MSFDRRNSESKEEKKSSSSNESSTSAQEYLSKITPLIQQLEAKRESLLPDEKTTLGQFYYYEGNFSEGIHLLEEANDELKTDGVYAESALLRLLVAYSEAGESKYVSRAINLIKKIAQEGDEHQCSNVVDWLVTATEKEYPNADEILKQLYASIYFGPKAFKIFSEESEELTRGFGRYNYLRVNEFEKNYRKIASAAMKLGKLNFEKNELDNFCYMSTYFKDKDAYDFCISLGADSDSSVRDFFTPFRGAEEVSFLNHMLRKSKFSPQIINVALNWILRNSSTVDVLDLDTTKLLIKQGAYTTGKELVTLLFNISLLRLSRYDFDRAIQNIYKRSYDVNDIEIFSALLESLVKNNIKIDDSMRAPEEYNSDCYGSISFALDTLQDNLPAFKKEIFYLRGLATECLPVDASSKEVNKKKARRYYVNAASAGDVKACVKLIKMAIENKNFDDAAEWSKSAALTTTHAGIEGSENVGYLLTSGLDIKNILDMTEYLASPELCNQNSNFRLRGLDLACRAYYQEHPEDEKSIKTQSWDQIKHIFALMLGGAKTFSEQFSGKPNFINPENLRMCIQYCDEAVLHYCKEKDFNKAHEWYLASCYIDNQAPKKITKNDFDILKLEILSKAPATLVSSSGGLDEEEGKEEKKEHKGEEKKNDKEKTKGLHIVAKGLTLFNQGRVMDGSTDAVVKAQILITHFERQKSNPLQDRDPALYFDTIVQLNTSFFELITSNTLSFSSSVKKMLLQKMYSIQEIAMEGLLLNIRESNGAVNIKAKQQYIDAYNLIDKIMYEPKIIEKIGKKGLRFSQDELQKKPSLLRKRLREFAKDDLIYARLYAEVSGGLKNPEDSSKKRDKDKFESFVKTFGKTYGEARVTELREIYNKASKKASTSEQKPVSLSSHRPR